MLGRHGRLEQGNASIGPCLGGKTPPSGAKLGEGAGAEGEPGPGVLGVSMNTHALQAPRSLLHTSPGTVRPPGLLDHNWICPAAVGAKQAHLTQPCLASNW